MNFKCNLSVAAETLVAVIVAAAMVVACGGGGGSTPAPNTTAGTFAGTWRVNSGMETCNTSIFPPSGPAFSVVIPSSGTIPLTTTPVTIPLLGVTSSNQVSGSVLTGGALNVSLSYTTTSGGNTTNSTCTVTGTLTKTGTSTGTGSGSSSCTRNSPAQTCTSKWNATLP